MTKRSRYLAAALMASATLFGGSAEATDLFRTHIVVTGGNSGGESTNSFRDVPDLFDADRIADAVGGFDPTSQGFIAVLDFRGLPTQLAWDSGETTLTFSLPGVFDISFTSDTLDGAIDDLEDWLTGDLDADQAANDLLNDFLQALVERSPVDPVAGNPNSLQSRMFQSDYRLGTEGPFTSGGERLSPATNLVGLGFEYGHSNAGPWAVDALDLPIDYRFNFANPKWSLLFNLPITATFTEDQWSVLASGGMGFQFRPFDWWSLTPMVRIGMAGSIDVGALAVMYSTSVTNHMKYEWRDITFAMGNTVGFTKTIDGIEINDYEIAYDLTNPYMTNGGYISGGLPFELLGPTGWKIFGQNTQIWGDDVYASSQSEVGAAFEILGQVGEAPYEKLGLSASYVFGGDDYDGVSLRFRWRF
jgi:hypothetical protein